MSVGKWIIVTCLWLIGMPTMGQDLYDLTLEELMDMRVSIASRRDEDYLSAPGMLTVISAQELSRYGARNLHDAMRLVPSLQQVYPQYGHRSAVAIRGQLAGGTDKYLLMLLNGKPLRDPILYGVNTPVYEGFPLSVIDRIEIIRGPGAVVYGSNAFSGVMDIITKPVEDRVLVKTQAGSFGTRINEVTMDKQVSPQVSAQISARSYDTDGWDLEFVDTGGIEDSFKNRNRSYGLFTAIEAYGVTANIFKAEAKEIATLSSGLIADAEERPSDRLFWSVDFDVDLSSNWHSHFNLSENQSDVAATTEYDASDQVFEWLLHNDDGEMQHSAGLNYHHNELILPDGVLASEVTYTSLFYQLSMKVFENSRLTAGLQVMDPEKSDVQVTPRLALNSEWNEHLYTKLMYGRAYSSPTGVEFSLNIPNLFIASDRLLPTVTDSYEAQIIYHESSWMASAGIYYSTEEDGIELVSTVPGQALPKQFQNIDTIYYRGIELEARADISKQLLMQGSYSLQNSNSETESSLLSRHLLKLGISYQPSHGLQLGLFNVFHSQSTNRDPLPNEFNESESNFSHLTANLEYEIFKNWNQTSLRLTGYIDNLLNEDAEFLPDPILSNLNTMPKVAGRSYYVGLQFQY